MAGLSKSATYQKISPQIKDREDLFSSQVIKEFNTYSTWDEMKLYNDVTDIVFKQDSNGKYVEQPSTKSGYGVKSIFNKWTLVPVLNNDVRTKLNVPLIDTTETRKMIKERSNPSIRNLVEASREGILGRETYDYSDFMYCKYLGKMPNNYLITLRRFPIACNDYIGQLADASDEREIAVSLGCMVTWLGTPGNDMENILTYNFKMPFKDVDSKLEDVNYNDNSSPLASMFSAFDSKYQQQVADGTAGQAISSFMDKLHLPNGAAPYTDHLTWKDANKVYGPIDVVKKTSMRSEEGLDFQQQFSLKFEYELRSYSNVNTRQAMLDLLANILTVTYVNGSFWRGGYRGLGPHQSDVFSNLKCMKKEHKGVSDFIDSFASDISTVSSGIKEKFKGKDILSTLKNIANSFGGMLIGGMLNKLGRPQKVMVNSLLSPAPVGLWHVTVGNPFHPIMSIGNLILDNTKITHQGPLGLDDFPTKLIVECTLKRAKGRDANDIERLYNLGATRIYSGLEKHTIELIQSAPIYKDKEKFKNNQNTKRSNVSADDVDNTPKLSKFYSSMINDLEDAGNAAKQFWNTHDFDAVLLAGKEWMRGAGEAAKNAKTGKSSNNISKT